MNLTDDQVSEAIAAVMGIEYHQKRDKYLCDGCPSISMHKCDNCYEPYFDAFAPDGKRMNYDVIEYMEKEMDTVWSDYLTDQFYDRGNIEAFRNAHNPAKLVEWLYKELDNLDSWGHEKCWHTGFVDREQCKKCNGIGKVLTEKAKRFKAIIEMSQTEEVG
jgi:hypothetical protein